MNSIELVFNSVYQNDVNEVYYKSEMTKFAWHYLTVDLSVTEDGDAVGAACPLFLDYGANI